MYTIICVGKLKEKYLKEAEGEYLKRLTRLTKVNIVEVCDEKIDESASYNEIEIIKIKEGKNILKHIKQGSYIITLVINGVHLSSYEFSKEIKSLNNNGISNVVFIIGGSLGLSDEIINLSNFKLSLSKMTFPHQMARIILLEQIYRSYKIIKNEPYHK